MTIPRTSEAVTMAQGQAALSALIYNNRRAVPIIERYPIMLCYTRYGAPVVVHGETYWRTRPVRVGTEGFPDQWGVLDGGRTCFFEWKSETGKLETVQRARREAILASGALYVQPRTVEFACAEVLRALRGE